MVMLLSEATMVRLACSFPFHPSAFESNLVVVMYISAD